MIERGGGTSMGCTLPRGRLPFCRTWTRSPRSGGWTAPSPLVPLRGGMPERHAYGSKRNGTSTLFVALNVASGEVISKCYL